MKRNCLDTTFHLTVLIATLIFLTSSTSLAQQKEDARNLPSPEKIVGEYFKAIGGKKRLARFKDATFEWTVTEEGQAIGRARTQTKAPTSSRTDLIFEGGETSTAANARTAWMRGVDGILRTLTDREASAARLQAVLDASRLVDYKKRDVRARTLALDQTGAEPAYIVEFTSRGGGRLQYWFSASTKLLLKIVDETRQSIISLGDYRADKGIREPYRLGVEGKGTDSRRVFVRQSAAYNTGLSDNLFDPPRSAESFNITALLREVTRNQEKIDERLREYTYLQKQIARDINSRGEVTKETIKISEVYPLPGRRPVFKLISENGVPLSPERAAREAKRAGEELAEAERNGEKDAQKRERKRQKRAQENEETEEEDEDARYFTGVILRACESVSPRRERFRDRDAVVFDFRPRAGFRPSNRIESIVGKLNGILWIDPVDKQVMRFEARLAQGFKIAGGLLASVRPGSALIVEQTRLPVGVWLPRYAQFNASIKFLLFAGGNYNLTLEWSDYRRFNAEAGEVKLDAPKTP